MTKERSELKSIGYEIFIGILSILSIVNLVLAYAAQEQSLATVLEVMNGLFSMIFLADFLYRIFTAPSAGTYFFKHFGWADLLASLPFAQLKFLRVFRLIRVYRLLRDVGIRTVGRALSKDRAGSSLYILLLMGIFVLEFGSLTMLRIEQHAPGANITTASDAIWYTIVTISTVGYGDQYPVTGAGRISGQASSSSASASSAPSPATWPTSSCLPGRRNPHRPSTRPTPARRSKDSACASKSPKPSSPRSESCSPSQPSEGIQARQPARVFRRTSDFWHCRSVPVGQELDLRYRVWYRPGPGATGRLPLTGRFCPTPSGDSIE